MKKIPSTKSSRGWFPDWLLKNLHTLLHVWLFDSHFKNIPRWKLLREWKFHESTKGKFQWANRNFWEFASNWKCPSVLEHLWNWGLRVGWRGWNNCSRLSGSCIWCSVRIAVEKRDRHFIFNTCGEYSQGFSLIFQNGCEHKSFAAKLCN